MVLRHQRSLLRCRHQGTGKGQRYVYKKGVDEEWIPGELRSKGLKMNYIKSLFLFYVFCQ